jgi:hypothetical protein
LGVDHDAEPRTDEALMKGQNMGPALALLHRSWRYAQQLDRPVWDFAVEIHTLQRLGLTTSDLRWLACKGYVEHADEVRIAGQEVRTFQRYGPLSFSKRTSFILTEKGLLLYRLDEPERNEHCANHERPSSHVNGAPTEARVPSWDRDRQELRLGGILVKQFKVPAPNQEIILSTFQDDGWPPRIDDPLPPQQNQDSKRRLHDTINALNRNQKQPLLRFLGDGSGEGILWQPVLGAPTDESF